MKRPDTLQPVPDSQFPAFITLETCCHHLPMVVPSFIYGGAEIELLGCHANRSRAGTVIRPHRHSYTEIILILSGEAQEESVPGSILSGGMIQVHAPGAVHAWRCVDQELLRIGMWLKVRPITPITLPADWPIHPDMAAAVRALAAAAQSTAPGRRERMLASLILLLAPALELFSLPEQASLVGSPRLPVSQDAIAHVERFLSDNLAEPLTLEDVAVQLSVSVPTLTRRFRQATGCSVMTRLLELRMGRAAELLREGRLSVKQIAAAVGIPEPSYFCRCFRKAHGCTPLSFRMDLISAQKAHPASLEERGRR
jgi:AraC-like DNA-binding protein